MLFYYPGDSPMNAKAIDDMPLEEVDDIIKFDFS